MTDLINTELGQYRLTEIIRHGGMATVYKAYQDSLDRYVAVKVLQHGNDPQFAPRFKREARAIAQLQHHNILPVYDYGEQDGLLYLAMQYIENGVTLGDMIGRSLTLSTSLRLMGHLLDALEYAHRRGVIHRDIKPANVLMPSPVWPMLADFGIVKLLNETSLNLTVPGLIIGTAAYVAPEQVTGKPVDARTDVYAAGVMLFEMLTGQVPFDGDTAMTVLTRHAYEPPPSPRLLNPTLPLPVEAALLRALAKDPAARYQSAREMAKELERVAVLVEKLDSRNQLTGLYQVGVQAFEEARWNVAVERLGQLVALDPSYEDAAELLEAAREAQERTKEQARQQIEQVRQRRQSTVRQDIQPSDATPTTPVDPRATRKLVRPTEQVHPVAPEAPPAQPAATGVPDAAPPAPARVSASTAKLTDPADSAVSSEPPQRRALVWAIVAATVIALLVFVILITRL